MYLSYILYCRVLWVRLDAFYLYRFPRLKSDLVIFYNNLTFDSALTHLAALFQIPF